MKVRYWPINDRRQRIKMMAVSLFAIMDEIVNLATFGAIDTEFRQHLLFSDWLDDNSHWVKGFWTALNGRG